MIFPFISAPQRFFYTFSSFAAPQAKFLTCSLRFSAADEKLDDFPFYLSAVGDFFVSWYMSCEEAFFCCLQLPVTEVAPDVMRINFVIVSNENDKSFVLCYVRKTIFSLPFCSSHMTSPRNIIIIHFVHLMFIFFS